MCEDCGTDWPDQTEAEIAWLKSRIVELERQVAYRDTLLKASVLWEPEDGWPTVEQVRVWKGEYRAWYCAVGPVLLDVDGDYIRATTSEGVIYSRGHVLGLRALVPFREGQPVSWAEVDAAVEAAKGGPG